jgi:protein TonB
MTIDEYPRFPGGEDALISYLHNNIKYPPNAREKGIEGTVYIGCEIKEDGSIGVVKVKRDIPDSGFAKEGVRVIQTMPKWTPAMKDGKAVRSFIYIPIQFFLQ